MTSVQVKLTAEQRDFIRRAVASGRVPNTQDAVQGALALWVERKRRREDILAAVDQAEASLARGEGRVITRELAEEVHQREVVRLAADEAKRH